MGAPSLRGLQGRSATGLNGQAAKEEVSALSRGGWMPENISGVPAGRSVFHLTSPLIGLLAQPRSPSTLSACYWSYDHPSPSSAHMLKTVTAGGLVGSVYSISATMRERHHPVAGELILKQ
jgi:hypothetical protein